MRRYSTFPQLQLRAAWPATPRMGVFTAPMFACDRLGWLPLRIQNGRLLIELCRDAHYEYRPNVFALRRGEAPWAGGPSGRPLAATNVKTAGSVCKRHDAVHLGREKGLQPRASERPAVACSAELARVSAASSLEVVCSMALPAGFKIPSRQSESTTAHMASAGR